VNAPKRLTVPAVEHIPLHCGNARREVDRALLAEINAGRVRLLAVTRRGIAFEYLNAARPDVRSAE